MPRHPILGALLSLTAAPALAQAAAPVPDFQDLETAYARDGDTVGAERSLAVALPAGMPAAQARAALAGVGATCGASRKAPEVERCLIHQYSLADGAADDIRWAVLLTHRGGQILSVALNRYVDRHGTN